MVKKMWSMDDIYQLLKGTKESLTSLEKPASEKEMREQTRFIIGNTIRVLTWYSDLTNYQKMGLLESLIDFLDALKDKLDRDGDALRLVSYEITMGSTPWISFTFTPASKFQ